MTNEFPESIRRADLIAAIETLGFDARDVFRIDITGGRVIATTFHRDANGVRGLINAANNSEGYLKETRVIFVDDTGYEGPESKLTGDTR